MQQSNCPFQNFDKNSVHTYNRVPSEWREVGQDKCCDYCGSWHPQEFLEYLKEFTENPNDKVRIELNTRRDKIYIHRPDVFNAGEGAIKVYTSHIKTYAMEMGFDLYEIEKQVTKALMVSSGKAKRHADEIMNSIKNQKN